VRNSGIESQAVTAAEPTGGPRRGVLVAILGLVMVVVAAVGVLVPGDGGDTDETERAHADQTAPTQPVGSAGRASSTSSPRPSQQPTEPVPPPETTAPASHEGVDEPFPAPGVPACSTAGWGSDAQIASLLFVSLSQSSVGELEWALEAQVGGVFIGTGAVPLVTSGQVAAATGAVARPPLVAIDEEGGRVQRLAGHLGALPSAREMGRTMSPDAVRGLAREHGAKLGELGITVVFAPVVDVTDAPAATVIGDRSFGASADVVTSHGGAFALGLTDSGLVPTLKHFPGHGRGSGDSHYELVFTPPLGEMGPDLAPYRDLLSVVPGVAVMVGHLRVPGLDDEPATTSHAAITGLLRGELGFDGLVVTDDLGGMVGIRQLYSVPDASVRAVMAGADMVLVPVGEMGQVTAALQAAVADGRLPHDQLQASADRVLRARSGAACPH